MLTKKSYLKSIFFQGQVTMRVADYKFKIE